MPLESQGDPRRLLSSDMEDRLIGWLTRAGGVLLLAGVGAAWASLLTWSQTDPSLTHAAGGAPSNALGTTGAMFADVMLNTLGFAAVFLLLAPMFWGIELMLAGRIFANRKKTSVFPLSVLLLAGGFAVLPVTESWPFAHSFGGIVGDWLYKVTATIFALVGAEGATAAGRPRLLRRGLCRARLFHRAGARGYQSSDRAQPRTCPPARVALGGRCQLWLAVRVHAHARRRANSSPSRTDLGPGIVPSLSFAPAAACAASPICPCRLPWLRAQPAPALASPAARARLLPPGTTSRTDDDLPVGRDMAFDACTDAESRAIAERFAPASAKRRRRSPCCRASSARLRSLRWRTRSRSRVRARPRALQVSPSCGRLPAYRAPSLNLLKRPPRPSPAPSLRKRRCAAARACSRRCSPTSPSRARCARSSPAPSSRCSSWSRHAAPSRRASWRWPRTSPAP